MNLSWHYNSKHALVLETPLPECRFVMKLRGEVGELMLDELRGKYRTTVTLEEVLDWLRNNTGLL